MIRLSLHDHLSPALRELTRTLTPTVRRALGRGAAAGRRVARESADRFLHPRTRRGRRGIRYRVRRVGSVFRAEIWPSVGYLAAHELGSAIPAMTIRPVRARLLRFLQDGEERFARFVEVPARNLPRRPWLSTAAPAIERAVVAALEAEMTTLTRAITR